MTAAAPSWEAVTVGIALVATMAAYALFAGADFGGGIWDLAAGSSPAGRRARDAIDASVTPVWEGNQVWIVLGLVLLWTGFPSAFAAITITLFVPLAASVLGLVLRGVGFAFRHEAVRPTSKRLTGALFATSSLLAPFFLGTAVGAVTTGRIPVPSHGLGTAAWTTPTGLVTGALFVAACAFIGAVYLVGDARRRGHEDLVPYFGHRAVASGVATGVLAAVNLALLHGSAPYVFGRLTGVALPLVIVSVLAGGAAVTLILLRRQWLLRIFGALSVAAVVARGAWPSTRGCFPPTSACPPPPRPAPARPPRSSSSAWPWSSSCRPSPSCTGCSNTAASNTTPPRSSCVAPPAPRIGPRQRLSRHRRPRRGPRDCWPPQSSR